MLCSDAGAVVGGWLGICLHGVLIALMSKLLIGQASLWWASFFCLFFFCFFLSLPHYAVTKTVDMGSDEGDHRKVGVQPACEQFPPPPPPPPPPPRGWSCIHCDPGYQHATGR